MGLRPTLAALGRCSSLLLLAGALLTVACKRKAEPEATTPAQALSVEFTGNPFKGVQLYVAPYNNADQARRRLETENPGEALLVAKIAETPQARWLGEWSGENALETESRRWKAKGAESMSF